jgi:hypothetical protein
MRMKLIAVLLGGGLLLSSMTALAGTLTGVNTVGSGLTAKIEVVADAPLTYVFFRKDATHWVVELAKTEIGSVAPTMELTIPAATGLTLEKRQAGSIPITRLTIAVRPGVTLLVKSSGDRKQLNLSFQSGSAPAAAGKDDDLLGDLDAPAKPATAEKAPAAKDDLDSLLDSPAPATTATGAVAAPVVAPTAPVKAAELSLEAELGKEPAAAAPVAAKPAPSLDKELDAGLEPAPAPAKPVLAPVVPEKVPPVEAKLPETKIARDPLPVAAVAVPAGVDLGALTPDELGIAPPETAAPQAAPPVQTAAPVKMVEPEPAAPAPVQPAVEAAPVPASAPAVAKPTAGAGSILVHERTVEVTVTNYSSHKAFTLTDPTRLVIDLPGAKASLKDAAAKAKVPGIQAVRFSQYPDKVRLVFDLPKGELPDYAIEKLENGIRVTFK